MVNEPLVFELLRFDCICFIVKCFIDEVEVPMRTEYMFVIWSCIRTKGEVSRE